MTTVDFWAWYPVEIGTIFFVGVGASIVAAVSVVSYRVWRTVSVWIDRRMRDSTRQMEIAMRAEAGSADAEITGNRRVGHCCIRLAFLACCVCAKRAAERAKRDVCEPCVRGCCPKSQSAGKNWSSPFDEQQQMGASLLESEALGSGACAGGAGGGGMERGSAALGVANSRTGVISARRGTAAYGASQRGAPVNVSVERANGFDDGADHLRDAVESCEAITTTGLDDAALSEFIGSGGTPGRESSLVDFAGSGGGY
jgi:hypothetical protein